MPDNEDDICRCEKCNEDKSTFTWRIMLQVKTGDQMALSSMFQVRLLISPPDEHRRLHGQHVGQRLPGDRREGPQHRRPGPRQVRARTFKWRDRSIVVN